ncbi:hypothetical protein ABMV16_04685 [Corynebacterium belfantii]
MGSISLRARSSLSQQQREQLVDLFKHGIDYSAASRQLSVSKYAVRKLLRRFKLHSRLCLVKKPNETAPFLRS